MNAKERYMVATTEDGRRKLMDFVQHKKLEQTFSRPSSTELERAQAADKAQRPDEEIIGAREEESDRGFPAPLNQEQAEYYRLVLERRKRQTQEEDQDLVPAASEPEGSVSAGDAMSSERAGALDETSSDKASFVTGVAGSVSSRADRQEVLVGSRQVGSRKERKKQNRSTCSGEVEERLRGAAAI